MQSNQNFYNVAGENTKWYRLLEKVVSENGRCTLKLCDSAVLLWGVYFREMKTYVHAVT